MTEVLPSTEVIDHAPRHLVKTSIFDMDPEKQVEFAARIATTLANVIEKQHLYTNIQGRKYVKVEGWEVLGTFLGVLPRERLVTELPDGSYEAFVDLIRSSDGVVIGGSSAICGVDEKRWGTADRYARRSMAITRAVGKAYRTSFSWIISLAGYQPTPEEEMPQELYQEKPEQKKKLAAIAKEEGITQKEALQEISSALVAKHIPMGSLRQAILSYINLPI